MSTTRASSTTSWPSMPSTPTIIFWMPSVSATSISLRPRRSRRKSIFSRENTRRRCTLLSSVFRLSRVASVIHPGTSPCAVTPVTPTVSGWSAVGMTAGAGACRSPRGHR